MVVLTGYAAVWGGFIASRPKPWWGIAIVGAVVLIAGLVSAFILGLPAIATPILGLGCFAVLVAIGVVLHPELNHRLRVDKRERTRKRDTGP